MGWLLCSRPKPMFFHPPEQPLGGALFGVANLFALKICTGEENQVGKEENCTFDLGAVHEDFRLSFWPPGGVIYLARPAGFGYLPWGKLTCPGLGSAPGRKKVVGGGNGVK